MKSKMYVLALAMSVALCSQGFAGLFDGGCSTCGPAVCDPCQTCDPCGRSCDLFSGLRSLFPCNRSCPPAACAPACHPCEPVGCAIPEPAACDAACAPACVTPLFPRIRARLACMRCGVDTGCGCDAAFEPCAPAVEACAPVCRPVRKPIVIRIPRLGLLDALDNLFACRPCGHNACAPAACEPACGYAGCGVGNVGGAAPIRTAPVRVAPEEAAPLPIAP